MASENSILMFGDFDYSYPREITLRHGLEKNDINVLDCRLGERRNLVGWKKIIILFPAIVKLIYKFYRTDLDSVRAIIVPRGNHLLVPVAKLLSLITEIPLIYDAFDPLFRTAIMEDENGLLVKYKYILEYLILRLPDKLLVTTSTFKQLYAKDYSLSLNRFEVIPPSANEDRFYPRDLSSYDDFTVLYWGNFHPHHGVDIILEAAEILSDKKIQFILIGEGEERERYRKRSMEAGLDQVHFPGRLSDSELINNIERSHVCLGVFSDHQLAQCSITNKVFEAMAMGKPIITENSEATRSLPDNALIRVPPTSPEELAKEIRCLQQDTNMRADYSTNARKIFEDQYSEKAIGNILQIELLE